MGLVGYSSEEEEEEEEEKTTTKATAATATAAPLPQPPPLPPAFHDLYAPAVRTAPADDPSLHQGRHRSIPHVAGRWPSHLYINWFPTPSEHERLSALLVSLRDALGDDGDGDDSGDNRRDGDGRIHSFLTSDLGAPLPLHISLSRPFVLTTAGKDAFLAGLVDAIQASNVAPFDVVLSGLDWYRGPDSARAFLVLRAIAVGGRDGDSEHDTPLLDPSNAPLAALLDRCNRCVTTAGQPALYASTGSAVMATRTASAFHASVAWTLAPNVDAWADATRRSYAQWARADAERPAAHPLRIRVNSMKARIGSTVTDIPLTGCRATTAGRPKRSRSGSGGSCGVPENSNGADDADNSRRRRPKRNLFGL